MAAILVIDSGVGGLSILNAIQKKLPNESYLYFSDFGFLPYGEKEPDFLCERVKHIVEYFIEREDIKAVVIACNTATVAAIQFLRERFELPVFGIEPGIKPAARSSREGIVVFATTGTLNSDQFNRLIRLYADDKPVYSRAVPAWVELVESEAPENEVVNHLKAELDSIPEKFDTVLLGCTHFSFLKEALSSLLPDNVEVIDTSEAVANWVQEKLTQEKLLASDKMESSSGKSSLSIYGSANREMKAEALLLKLSKRVNKSFEITEKNIIDL